MQKLNIKAAGLALGILWGASIFLLGIFSMFDYGRILVDLIAEYYIGYGASFLGSIIGGVWGFIDAFVGGVVLAWLYNKLV